MDIVVLHVLKPSRGGRRKGRGWHLFQSSEWAMRRRAEYVAEHAAPSIPPRQVPWFQKEANASLLVTRSY